MITKELYVENAAVMHNDGGCSCGSHTNNGHTELAVANQEDLLGLPDWEFENPLAKEDPIVTNTNKQFVENRGREIHGRDCLGLPEWHFENPLKDPRPR